MMKKMKEDEKVREKQLKQAERQELQYLDREFDEYNKLRKGLDKAAKNQNAIDLLGQVKKDKNLEDAIKRRELDEMQRKINQY
jgi:hypothetical protein